MVAEPSRGAAFGDIDNDGKIDVVVENIDGRPMILRNVSTDKNHWLTVRLTASNANRLAIGAKLTITAGGMTQIGEVRSGGSYLSQNDFRLHFGLAAAAKVDKLEIRWPSGKIDTFKNMNVDHFYSLREGNAEPQLER
jgi:hypothetical protein